MKTVVALLLLAWLAAPLRADWTDLRPGMDAAAVRACIGHPILLQRGRVKIEIWTYDQRGYVELHRGRLIYWNAPVTAEPAKPSQVIAADAKAVKPARKPSAREVLASLHGHPNPAREKF